MRTTAAQLASAIALIVMGAALPALGQSEDATAPRAESAEPLKPRTGEIQAPTVLVFDLEEGEAASGLAKTIGGLITTTIDEKSKLEVLSGQDIRRAMELSAEQAAMGCTDDTSCLVEVADALGATYVVFGDVGKLGSTLIVQLSVLNTQKGTVVSRQAIRADTEAALIDQVPAGTASLMNPVLAAEGLEAMEGLELKDLSAQNTVAQPAPMNVPAVATASAGGVLAVLGTVGALVSAVPYGLYALDSMALNSLENGVQGPVDKGTLDQAQELQNSRALYQDVHASYGQWGMIGAGAVAGIGVATLAAGVVWLALPSGTPEEESAE